MRRVKSKGTSTEVAVRRLLHSLGYRYRLHGKGLPGSPDIVFASRKKAVFVHGCFWHGHDCRHGTRLPKTNSNYWRPKIARNMERDAEALAALESMGWSAVVVWECELRDSGAVRNRLVAFLGPTSVSRGQAACLR